MAPRFAVVISSACSRRHTVDEVIYKPNEARPREEACDTLKKLFKLTTSLLDLRGIQTECLDIA